MTLRRTSLILLIAIVAVAMCGTTYAQSIIGSPGNGWQTWNLAVDPNDNYHYVDLNSNGAPYWDVPLLTFGDNESGENFPLNVPPYFAQSGGNYANKSVGWCLTSTGDCHGVGSALVAPGPIPFWGGLYNSATDSGGAMDPVMYFKASSGVTYQATLYLNTASNTNEINEFGWFETDAYGSVNGTRHALFQGSGNPPGTNTPDPEGKVVAFTPTQYFGYYFQDVSDPQTVTPYQGCLAYTIFAFNDPDCTANGTSSYGPGQGDHVFAVFLQQSPHRSPIYWIAGQDPSTCNADGDCNLTIVKVRRLPVSD
jgi:hypothetical protein